MSGTQAGWAQKAQHCHVTASKISSIFCVVNTKEKLAQACCSYLHAIFGSLCGWRLTAWEPEYQHKCFFSSCKSGPWFLPGNTEAPPVELVQTLVVDLLLPAGAPVALLALSLLFRTAVAKHCCCCQQWLRSSRGSRQDRYLFVLWLQLNSCGLPQ